MIIMKLSSHYHQIVQDNPGGDIIHASYEKSFPESNMRGCAAIVLLLFRLVNTEEVLLRSSFASKRLKERVFTSE